MHQIKKGGHEIAGMFGSNWMKRFRGVVGAVVVRRRIKIRSASHLFCTARDCRKDEMIRVWPNVSARDFHPPQTSRHASTFIDTMHIESKCVDIWIIPTLHASGGLVTSPKFVDACFQLSTDRPSQARQLLTFRRDIL